MRLLFEIGMEELPARFLVEALENLKTNLTKKFEENRIKHSEIKYFGTPRRLILSIDEVSEVQEDLNVVNMGPAKSVAFDSNGVISRAGLGFLKSQGVEPENVEIVETPKGEYIAVKKFMKGEETKKLLPEILKTLVTELTFPKSMKWSDKKMRFARPIKWFLPLYGNDVVDFEIEGLKSSNVSRGHRFFGSDFTVNSIDEYFTKIRENNVIIDIEERKALIVKLIEEKCNTESEKALIEPELLDEVANLVEYPYPIVGTFNSEFLEVPQEVLIISMQVHQRYFPILNSEGKLQSKFVVIRNGIEHSDNVRIGNEKVLSARLADARFFYNEDLKNSLESYVNKLKTVVYQKDLGTIYEKVERTKKIAEYLVKELGQEDKLDSVLRTVHLAKADLMTNMIGEKEFTKLQGFMGEEYALKSGESKEVATGIKEHYYPRFQGDLLPTEIEGIITGLSDRLDTLVGCFAVGLIPTGSKDPFALRRAALGIVNIILNSNLEFSLSKTVRYILAILEDDGVLKRESTPVYEEIIEFILQRIINVFGDHGMRRDITSAVLSVDNHSLVEASIKVKALEKYSSDANFEKFLTLIKRIGNISKEAKSDKFEKGLLVSQVERELADYTDNFEMNSEKYLQDKDYSALINEILSSVDLIDRYFSEVMIMDKDEDIKNNRLAQMRKLDMLFNRVANLKLIENN